jgi:hypothetical protein
LRLWVFWRSFYPHELRLCPVDPASLKQGDILDGRRFAQLAGA